MRSISQAEQESPSAIFGAARRSGTTEALKKRVARRFSIIGGGHGFSVFIEDEEVLPSDRGYYDKIRYLWTYRDQENAAGLCSNIEIHEDRTSIVKNQSIAISGWLATVNEVRHLKDEDGDNLNRIAIFIRGKMAQEDILGDFFGTRSLCELSYWRTSRRRSRQV